MTTQGAGPRSSGGESRGGGRRTGLTLGVLAVVAIVLVAAVVIGLNLVGRPASPTAVGTPSPTGTSASPTDSMSPSPTASGTLPVPSAPDLAWQRLEGALDPDAAVAGVTNINGRWFAVGTIGLAPAIWTSDEAIPRTWAKATLDTPASADHYAQVTRVLPHGNDLMAFGSWGVTASEQYSWITWRSTDGGATWTEARRDEAGLRTVTERGSGFIGAGWDSGGTTPFDSFISTSADGTTWVRTNPAAMHNSEVLELAAISDRLVAVGSSFADGGGLVTAAWYSDDQGATWTSGDTGGAVGTLYDVAPLGQGLVAVGGAGTPTAWITDDGITWRPHPMGAAAIPFTVAAMEAGGVVAVGNAFGQEIGPEHVWSSLDAVTWVDGGDLDQPGPRGARIAASAAFGTAVVMGGSCLVVDPRQPPCPTPLWLGLPKE